MGSQLMNIRMKLEEKRRRIESEKRRMEAQLNRQRQKVGKAAFLQAVSKVSEWWYLFPHFLPQGYLLLSQNGCFFSGHLHNLHLFIYWKHWRLNLIYAWKYGLVRRSARWVVFDYIRRRVRLFITSLTGFALLSIIRGVSESASMVEVKNITLVEFTLH